MKVRHPERRVFIGNLDYNTTSNDLRELFSGYGEIVDVYFPQDKKRLPPILKRVREAHEPINYGCAFVEFRTKEQAATIYGLQDLTDPYGRQIYISTAAKL
jgi:RNA recognition motif-containing protein